MWSVFPHFFAWLLALETILLDSQNPLGRLVNQCGYPLKKERKNTHESQHSRRLDSFDGLDGLDNLGKILSLYIKEPFPWVPVDHPLDYDIWLFYDIYFPAMTQAQTQTYAQTHQVDSIFLIAFYFFCLHSFFNHFKRTMARR